MTPFHEGEIAVQARTGRRREGARLGGAIRDAISPAAARFLAEVSTLAVGASAEDERVWASFWTGRPGVVTARADGRGVAIDRTAFTIGAGDPVAPLVRRGAMIGLLGIDLETRRRLRVNGVVSADAAGEIVVRTRETFGNCAMYIQRRHAVAGEPPVTPAAPTRGAVLGDAERALVARADTAFVASRHPDRGVDVSHRGGPPGFIGLDADGRTLLVPDYPGNNMFTTLGNVAVSPRAGIAIVDFAAGRWLSLTGDAEIVYAGGDAAGTAGTGRYWRLSVESWVAGNLDRRVRWVLIENSPFNPPAPMTPGEVI